MSETSVRLPDSPATPGAGASPTPWWRRLARSWRTRTLVPVVLIHGLAFTGMYVALYELTMDEVFSAHRHEAEQTLDRLAATFQDARPAPAPFPGHGAIRSLPGVGGTEAVSLFGRGGNLVATGQAGIDRDASREVRAALGQASHETTWFTRTGGGPLVGGTRLLWNGSSCQACHDGPPGSVLGALHVTHDASLEVAAAAGRLRVRLALLVAVWGALVLAMMRLKDVVIGRPIERIENALARAEQKAPLGTGDLDDLAARLDRTIWAVLEEGEARERSVSARLARAEQLAAVGELAASLTHEIRNPLAGVSSALDVLLADAKAASKERSANQVYRRMKRELERMNTSLSGLLSLARPRPPHKVPADMESVAEEAVAMFRPRASARGISLDLEAAPGAPAVEVDREMMAQLLLNLLTNALQAIEKEGRIRVSVSPFPNRDGVVLTVADTGRGMSPEELGRIFEPFFTTKEEGTGLGLPVCQRIVRAHGGALEVKSEAGAGTTVVVLVPGRRARAGTGLADPPGSGAEGGIPA